MLLRWLCKNASLCHCHTYVPRGELRAMRLLPGLHHDSVQESPTADKRKLELTTTKSCEDTTQEQNIADSKAHMIRVLLLQILQKCTEQLAHCGGPFAHVLLNQNSEGFLSNSATQRVPSKGGPWHRIATQKQLDDDMCNSRL